MATFTAEIFQNEYLPEAGTDVHAVFAVACSGAGSAGAGTNRAAEVLVIDTSGSMEVPSSKIREARIAVAAAIDAIDDGTLFAVVSGSSTAELVYPLSGRPSLAVAGERTRAEAKAAVRDIPAGGGTAIGSWLRFAHEVFATAPAGTQCHAVLLTDGKNEGEDARTLKDALASVQGSFQCDCRGVGADWDVRELRTVASSLLGSVELIADPRDMAEDFEAIIRSAAGRGVSDVRLRVWVPKGAELLFVRQVAPSISELTSSAVKVSDLICEFPTGAWGDESREFHIGVRVGSKPVGSEQLAARAQLVVDGAVVAQGLVKAVWSDDETLTTRIDPAVAHYTGQTELAEAIQEGLAAKAVGDERTATAKLGRAVALAAATGNEEATSRLRKVVDIEDVESGTVRLKRQIDKLDEVALDTASTKTTRVRP